MKQEHMLDCLLLQDVNFERGENCYLWDSAGRRSVDLESGSWSTVLGHGHPEVNRRMKEQIDRVVHLNVRHPNQWASMAAGSLARLAGMPGGEAVFLSSGSEAVEMAVESALRMTGRSSLLGFAGSYHAAYGLAGNLADPAWNLVDWRGEDHLARLDGLALGGIGALVLELGGSSPYFGRFPPIHLVQEMVARIRAAGGLVVVNEITTGLGRTGTWFAFQHYGIEPDIIALGKGLGNGYPVSAVLMNATTARRYAACGLRHAQSHQNNPLACAVACAVLEELESGSWVERGAALGQRFLAGLKRVPDSGQRVKECRGRGMLLAMELSSEGGLNAAALQAGLLERGFITGCYPAGHPAGSGLRLDPALTLPEAEMDRFLACLAELLSLDCQWR